MAVTDQQKLDFLLKKIGYTKTKTGSVVGTGAISGTPKQPFAEAIPSPLVVPNSSLWNEASSIPATAPGSDTPQVKVYLAGTSGLRMTADSTSSGQRAYIAYTTYNDTSSARLTNWIDTQFGSSYLIKVYKGDPNSGGVALSAAGSGSNDGWFFDYSAGVLNFNDTSVPSGVTDTNIYIVGYRYIGQTGAPTSGISTFSNLDLTVERNLDVGKQGGISTFRHNVQLLDNASAVFGTDSDGSIKHTGTNLQIFETTGNIQITNYANDQDVTIKSDDGSGGTTNYFKADGSTGEAKLFHYGNEKLKTTSTGISITGNNVVSGNVTAVDGTFSGNVSAVDATFTGNVSIAGTLTYEDAKNVDSVGLITARSGIRVTGGVIEAQAGENKIPSLYAAMGNLPSAGSYHGMFAHVHATGRGYFAHAGNWLELVNKEINGTVGTGTERYNVGPVDLTTLDVSGISTFAGNIDANGDLDVDGHTNLDNVSIAGVTSVASLTSGRVVTVGTAGKLQDSNNLTFDGSNLFVSGINITGGGATSILGADIVTRNLKATGITTLATTDINGDLDVDGHTNLDNVNISGITTIADDQKLYLGNDQDLELYYQTTGTPGAYVQTGTASGNLTIKNKDAGQYVYIHGDNIHLRSTSNNETFLQAQRNGAVSLWYDYVKRIETTSQGINVIGHSELDNVNISGVTTAAGNIIANGNIDLAGDLDVDGHTNLDNVSIAGVTTFAGAIDLNADLDVDGHTNLDNVSIAGVTTFAANARFNSTIGVHDGTTGGNGQYLRATGAGVTWGTFPTMRTSQTFTASSGQTSFSFTYNVGYLDVYVNGVKLTTSEFTANNGSSVVLSVGSFVGDIVELVSYFTTSYAAGESGITELVQDPTPQLGGNLDLFNKTVEGTGNVNMTGVVTATKFVGDGSALSGIVASGSGVVVKNSGSLVGTAGTIDFGANLSVSPVSAGIVTITGSAGGGSGISTISGVVNIVNDLDVDGHTNLDNVSIAGVSTFAGTITAATVNATGGAFTGNLRFSNNVGTLFGASDELQVFHSSGTSYISHNGSGQLQLRAKATEHGIKIFPDGAVELYHNNVKRLETSSVGVSIPQDLDVDGHTNLDNVSVAGVTTFTGAITASDIRSDSLNLKNAAGGATYASFTNGGSAILKHNNTDRLETSASGVSVTGTVAATAYTGDGSQLTGIVAGITTISGVANIANDLDVDGHTNLDNVSIAGVTTFAGAIDLNADLDVDGHTNLDNVTIAGVCTATNFVGDGSGLTNVIGSGSGVVVKDSGSTVGTAGTINFGSGLDVTDISAGIVTVSTATTSISSGNSKVFVNSESSSTNNGSFEVLLQDNTSSGAGHTAFKVYQPFDSQNKVEFFSNNFSLTSFLDLNCGFAGNAGNSLRFKTNGAYNFTSTIFVGTSKSFEFRPDGSNTTVQFTESNGAYFKTKIRPYGSDPVDIGTSGTKFRDLHITNVNAGVVTATAFHGDGSNLTGISGGGGTNVGITTNLSGSFTASAGTAATINTLTGYSANDLVVEYTIYIKNGSDFQTQKLLAMRDGTTIHSTQFAVMFSSSLLVQCDATISSGNILLRATPETGVSGSTTYKIKREVM